MFFFQILTHIAVYLHPRGIVDWSSFAKILVDAVQKYFCRIGLYKNLQYSLTLTGHFN